MTYAITGIEFDYAVNDIPLLSAASGQNPYGRQTAPYKKDQIDTSSEAGEQSLVYWWLRSQLSFHGGDGIEYEEPDPNFPLVQNRFQYSEGLDIFTKQGQTTLLKQAALLPTTGATAAAPICMGAVDGSGVDCFFTNFGSTVKRFNSTADNTNTGATVTWGGANTPTSACNDGANYYIADTVGIYSGTLVGGAGSKLWNTGATTIVAWVKQRLMAGIGQKLYELTGVAGAPTLPADGTTGHLYTHPSSAWKWTCFTESPSAILAAGYDGIHSTIYKMQVTAGNGSVPTLTPPIPVAEFPPGEQVLSMCTANGFYLAVGTSQGIRVATIDDNGNLEYGPLITTPTVVGAVHGVTSQSRFIYFTWSSMQADGRSGVGVIDLSLRTDTANVNPYITAPGRFAWCRAWAATSGAVNGTGTCWGVAMVGASGRLAFQVGTSGEIFMQHPSNLVPYGKLMTGKIRFHSIEPKLFEYVKARTLPLVGTVQVDFNCSDGTSGTLGTWSTQGEFDHADFTFQAINPGTCEWNYLTFTLTQHDATSGPTFTGYQVKALPAAKNQRLIVLPVYIYDHIRDHDGNLVGYDGYAASILSALESAEEARAPVLLQDFTVNAVDTSTGRSVVIDQITFTQQDPPARFQGFGGTAVLTLRTVT